MSILHFQRWIISKCASLVHMHLCRSAPDRTYPFRSRCSLLATTIYYLPFIYLHRAISIFTYPCNTFKFISHWEPRSDSWKQVNQSSVAMQCLRRSDRFHCTAQHFSSALICVWVCCCCFFFAFFPLPLMSSSIWPRRCASLVFLSLFAATSKNPFKAAGSAHRGCNWKTSSCGRFAPCSPLNIHSTLNVQKQTHTAARQYGRSRFRPEVVASSSSSQNAATDHQSKWTKIRISVLRNLNQIMRFSSSSDALFSFFHYACHTRQSRFRWCRVQFSFNQYRALRT